MKFGRAPTTLTIRSFIEFGERIIHPGLRPAHVADAIGKPARALIPEKTPLVPQVRDGPTGDGVGLLDFAKRQIRQDPGRAAMNVERMVSVMVIPGCELRGPKRPVPKLKSAPRSVGEHAGLAQRDEIEAGMKVVDPMLILGLAIPPRAVRPLSLYRPLHAIPPAE